MISKKAKEYLHSMAENYDLEFAEMKNNEMVIEILRRQEALVESLIERNTLLKATLELSNEGLIINNTGKVVIEWDNVSPIFEWAEQHVKTDKIEGRFAFLISSSKRDISSTEMKEVKERLKQSIDTMGLNHGR